MLFKPDTVSLKWRVGNQGSLNETSHYTINTQKHTFSPHNHIFLFSLFLATCSACKWPFSSTTINYT
jgi:hypothetical protein